MKIKGKGSAEKVKSMVFEFISQLDIDEEVTFELVSGKSIDVENLMKQNKRYLLNMRVICNGISCSCCPIEKQCDKFMIGTIDVAPEDLTTENIRDIINTQGKEFLFEEEFGKITK